MDVFLMMFCPVTIRQLMHLCKPALCILLVILITQLLDLHDLLSWLVSRRRMPRRSLYGAPKKVLGWWNNYGSPYFLQLILSVAAKIGTVP